ncbi:carboxypeptidase-like regulatory domain-containing protein [Hymenobacter sp. 15J16-1T3B]|uniref:carboxypeptidase-like regulatory domain-containing protein n=1 Tax=Hymenobacter sp. 15J16-1T3B TaxID=2886941 RepID=UPI001D11ADC0|nr:carboxypeptidase-like regulatory domain-containing protein [Hymenobacter sp. 15J16-1T3B]MCC3157094.1 carboxypeptidase-like regulatory domain-containing protein [Hymenobacter sp. 15J16-1T3B]
MLIRRLLAAPLLGLLTLPALAQPTPLQGQVLNAQTGLPVPFATLGVPRRGLGTVADEQGRYVLRLPALTDTVIVTSVGFGRVVVPPAALAAGQRVFKLPPEQQTLQTVQIAHRPVHPATLGRTQDKGDVRWMAGSSGLETVDTEWGWELGTVLTPPKPALLEELHVFFFDNTYEHLRFRLNLYALENGRPGKPLLSQDVQLKVVRWQKGWVTLDLRPYQIALAAQPVVATLQWLQSETSKPENKYFSIPVKRDPKQTMVERENSQALWTIHPMQPSLYFSLLTE